MNKTKVQIVFIAISLTILFQSCNLFDPKEDIPAYIKIENFDLTTNYNEQGTASHKINDVWVNLDGDYQGVYELPVTFPVLTEGKTNYTFRAGIKRNGIAASREFYPFFNFYTLDTVLTEGDIHIIQPKTSYKQGTLFDWMEDFEDPGLIFQPSERSDTLLIQSNEDVFQDSYGAIYLDEENSFFECVSIDSLMLSYKNKEIYLELNYKCNQNFVIGLDLIKLNGSESYSVISINPKDDWNKIHIRLTDIITSNSDAYFQRLFIKATNDPNVAESKIFIDNIKLVHF